MVLRHAPWLLLLLAFPRAAWLLRQRVLGPQVPNHLSPGTQNQGFGEKRCTAYKAPLKQAAQGTCILKASEKFFWVQARMCQFIQLCLLPAHLFDSPLKHSYLT